MGETIIVLLAFWVFIKIVKALLLDGVKATTEETDSKFWDSFQPMPVQQCR